MLAASLLLVVLAQPVQHRVEVLGRGGEAFWSTGGDLWAGVRADVTLEARRSAEGVASAQLTLNVLRGAERWTVELSRLWPGGLLIDADLPGPGGLVHAAVALGGTARVTRAGKTVAEAAPLRAVALTTGFHADDGTFRTLPAGRAGDLELLVHVEGLPEHGAVEIGFDRPDILVDGAPVAPAPRADATAPAWPGPLALGVGGSGSDRTVVLPLPMQALSPPVRATGSGAPASSAMQPEPIPSSPAPGNAAPAEPLPEGPSPANAGPAEPLPSGPTPGNAGPAQALPSSPAPGNAGQAQPLPSSPAPGNAGPAQPLPSSPAPGNAAPAQPLPSSPSPGNLAPAPMGAPPSPPHGDGTPAPIVHPPGVLPSGPAPEALPRERAQTRFARRGSKIDPSGQASSVPLRVQLRARSFDPLSRKLTRIALTDGR